MIIDGVEIKDGDPILLWDHPIPIYGIYVMSKKKTYNHHLALYCANLSWRNEKLKCRLLRYLQRSIKGKSEYITSKKALKEWRKEMTEKYPWPESKNIDNFFTITSKDNGSYK